jgi:hypothetical protein
MRLVVVVVVSVNEWPWRLLELTGDGLIVRLGGDSAVLFALSDVRSVIGQVVFFV